MAHLPATTKVGNVGSKRGPGLKMQTDMKLGKLKGIDKAKPMSRKNI